MPSPHQQHANEKRDHETAVVHASRAPKVEADHPPPITAIIIPFGDHQQHLRPDQRRRENVQTEIVNSILGQAVASGKLRRKPERYDETYRQEHAVGGYRNVESGYLE